MKTEKKTLYLDCASGISGDMMAAALLDLGADAKVLQKGLESLHLDGWQTKVSYVTKSGLRACDFEVILDQDNHDHDMEYLHGEAGPEHVHEKATHVHESVFSHVHEHESHVHAHEEAEHVQGTQENEGHAQGESGYAQGESGHEHGEHTHAHGRNFREISEILKKGALTPEALSLALRIFHIVAEAESQVHGKPIDEVHFHEVGAVDSIIDIAAAAICIDNLQIGEVIIPSLTEGTGQVRCQHGQLPIPVPATSAIAAAYGLPLQVKNIQGELVTPTGAAIAAAIKTGERLPERFKIQKIGVGAGKRDYKTAGILRAMLIESDMNDSQSAASQEPFDTDQALELETNLDDCTGEALGFAMEELFAAGALDVWYQPIYMKKNRPAYKLSVLCEAEKRPVMERLIFVHTTAIGIRCHAVQRTKLPRESRLVDTPYGQAQIKCCTCGEEKYYYPESDSVAKLARQQGKSFAEMYAELKYFAGQDT